MQKPVRPNKFYAPIFGPQQKVMCLVSGKNCRHVTHINFLGGGGVRIGNGVSDGLFFDQMMFRLCQLMCFLLP